MATLSYRGLLIHPCEPNGSGMRYYARNPGDGPAYLRAETLAGLRELIRGALA